jgi:hypothetical protein
MPDEGTAGPSTALRFGRDDKAGSWRSQRGRRLSGRTADPSERTIRFSAAPTALESSPRSISQPFRAGLTFGGRPSRPCILGDSCLVISPSTRRRQVSCAPNDTERCGNYPTQAKRGLEWATPNLVAGMSRLQSPSWTGLQPVRGRPKCPEPWEPRSIFHCYPA